MVVYGTKWSAKIKWSAACDRKYRDDMRAHTMTHHLGLRWKRWAFFFPHVFSSSLLWCDERHPSNVISHVTHPAPHCTPLFAKMAALPLTTSIPTTRVFCSRKPARARRFASFTPRASTTWTLDGVGCAGSRSGDEQLLRSAAPANRCPLKPIDVSSLCEAHEGKFEMQDVIFEQEGGRLFVTALWDADAEAS